MELFHESMTLWYDEIDKIMNLVIITIKINNNRRQFFVKNSGFLVEIAGRQFFNIR